MNHWQLFIVGGSFVYLVIAMGLYGWVTAKTQPYLQYLPPVITPNFIKVIFLVTSFGWPLVLQVYIYFKIVDFIGNLAGVEIDKLISADQINMQFSNKGEQVLDVEKAAESIAAQKTAEHVTEIGFFVVVDGKENSMAFDNKETLVEILSEAMPVGKFLRLLAKPIPGDEDPRGGPMPTRQAVAVGPNGEPIVLPTQEEIAEIIAKAPVQPMTYVPFGEDLARLDNLSLAKLLYSVASDRGQACQELTAIVDLLENHPNSTIQEHRARAKAILDAWAKAATKDATP